jgi:peptidoglycan-N-acetylglucosamine deacetylase
MQTRGVRFIGYFRAFCAGLAVFALFGAPARACGPEALGVARRIEIGQPATALGLKTYPRTLALQDHEVVLTFDDGPVAETTPKVLEALAAECALATFFLIGAHAEERPDLLRREAAEGHTLGAHSYDHPARTLRTMRSAAAKADIDKGIAAMRAALGAKYAGSLAPFFRFPGFADTPELLDWLAGRDITVFGADLWASDWRSMLPQQELELTLSRLEEARKGIILFHDNKTATAAMLPDFLRQLKARGFRLVHLVPGSGPTPVAAAPEGWTSTTEPIVERVLKGKAEE